MVAAGGHREQFSACRREGLTYNGRLWVSRLLCAWSYGANFLQQFLGYVPWLFSCPCYRQGRRSKSSPRFLNPTPNLRLTAQQSPRRPRHKPRALVSCYCRGKSSQESARRWWFWTSTAGSPPAWTSHFQMATV